MKESEASFDPVLFLDEQQKIFDEWHETYFPDGTKRYQFRTEKERVDNCRKQYGVAINENGVLYIKREHPCHVYTGDNACEKCLEYRKKKRESDFRERIDNVLDGGTSLYFVTTNNVVEQRSLSRRCKYHGYEFLSVPTGAGDERVNIVNGPLDGTSPISGQAAKSRLAQCSAVLFPDRSKRVSGGLGIEIDDDNRNGENVVNLVYREIVWGDKKMTAVDVAIANAKLARRMFKKEGTVKVTPENAQELLTSREDETMCMFRSMGFWCYFSKEKTKKFNIDAMAEQWLRISSEKYGVVGNINSADEVTQTVVKMAIDGLNSDLDEEDRFFDRVVSVAETVFRIDD